MSLSQRATGVDLEVLPASAWERYDLFAVLPGAELLSVSSAAELGGADVLVDGEERVLKGDQARVHDRVNVGQDGLDPLAGVDRLSDQRQVSGDVGEAVG